MPGRWSNHDLAQALANNPDLRLSPQNGSLADRKAGSGKAANEQSEPVLASVGLKEQGKKRKYRNEPTVVAGVRFDSKKEARRFGELQLLEKAGEIRSLTRQRTFNLEVNKVKICDYRCDFEYFELDRATGVWTWIVEDTKGFKTREYIIKKNLMRGVWGIIIRET